MEDERSSPPMVNPIVESIDSTPPLNTTEDDAAVDVTDPFERLKRFASVENTEAPNPETFGTQVAQTVTTEFNMDEIDAFTDTIPVKAATSAVN